MHFAPGDLPGILAAAAVYFVVNNALMAVALAFAQRVPILRYLLDDLPFQALAAGVLLSLSPAVVVAGDFSPLLIPLLALPLVAVHRSASASLENARLVSELEESLTRLADQAAENEYLAFHDALTSLPNRILFRDRVEAATRLAQREGSVAAVMIMDLDHFKEINDTLGHDHGDALLKQLGTRLRSVLRKSDTLARMGGDEFGILLPSVSGRDGAVRVADKVRRALEKPFDVDGMALEVSGTIGISLFPEHGGSVDKLIQRADVAMYWGKAAHTGYEFYDHRKDRYSPSRLSLVARLRQALEARELILHYQPKVELRTGEIRGVEALVRWRHPKRGLVPPGEFLPLTERTGLIGPLTSYVLNASLGKCRALRLAGFELAVAVNLSARNLSDAELPDEIAGLLARWQLPASALEVEITETSIMADPGRAIDVLGRLRRLGVVVLARRLRDRLLVAGVPQAAADRRDQDRQVVREQHDRGGGRRRHRPVHHRSGPEPRPPRGRRRGRDGGGLGPSEGASLRSRPGVLHRGADPLGGPGAVAGERPRSSPDDPAEAAPRPRGQHLPARTAAAAGRGLLTAAAHRSRVRFG